MTDGMGRRTFIASSLAVVGASAIGASAQEAASPPRRQVYVLQVYELANAGSVEKIDAYCQNALIPALKRAKAGPVGVLIETSKDAAPPTYYVLIPLESIEDAAALPRTLDADSEYAKAGEAFLKAPPKEPVYTNLETRLMLSADFMPKLQVPENKPTRLFELRRYRSPSEPAFRKKLEMFGPAGEAGIFRRVGLNAVFFGEMLAGPDMPNITYMLGYADENAKKAGWKAFGSDPEWKKLSTTPGYTNAEIIANIKSIMLKPAPYSEI